MSRFYLRRTPGPRETVGAALVATGAALGVAAISFYLTRILLSRDVLEPPRESERGRNLGPGRGVDEEASGSNA